MHFGLGDARQADTLLIRWPDGAMQELSQTGGKQRITVEKESTARESWKPQ